MTIPRAISTTNLEASPVTTRASSGALWAGRILRSVIVLFFLIDGGMKLVKPAVVVETTVRLGYPASTIVGIGVTLLVCTLLYVIPRTGVLGALFLTGYLGGAVASNVRAGTPAFNIAFPIICAVVMWAGLWLQNDTVRRLIPLTAD